MADIKELAISYWRMDKWLTNANVERKMAASSALRSIKKYLDSNGIEVLDLTGQKFDSGLAVDVINNDVPVDYSGDDTLISEMIKPIVMQNGAVIQFGQVSIGLSVKKLQDNNPIKEEKSVDTKAEDKQIIEEIKTVERSIQILSNKKLRIFSITFSIVIILLLVFSVCSLFFIKNNLSNEITDAVKQVNAGEISNDHDAILSKIESIENDIASLQQYEEKEKQNIAGVLNEINGRIDSVSDNCSITQDEIQKLIEKIESASEEIIDIKNITSDQTILIEDISEHLEKYLLNGTLLFEEYTIQKNDTLSKICKNKGIDLTKYGKFIQEINGIKNIDIIHEGQTIILPVMIREEN